MPCKTYMAGESRLAWPCMARQAWPDMEGCGTVWHGGADEARRGLDRYGLDRQTRQARHDIAGQGQSCPG